MATRPCAASHASKLLLLLLLLLPVHALSYNSTGLCPVLPKDGSSVLSNFYCGTIDFENLASQFLGSMPLEDCRKQRVGYAAHYMFYQSSTNYCTILDGPCIACDDQGDVGDVYANLTAIDFPPPTTTEGHGEPHFVGARGTHFDFNGELGRTFCLVSDKSVHINALFDGYYHSPAAKAGGKGLRTWMKEIGLLWKDGSGQSHVLVLKARRGTQVKRGDKGFLEGIILDGVSRRVPVQVNEEVKGVGFLLRFRNGMVVGHGANTRDKDVYSLHIEGVLDAEVSLNAELQGLRRPHDAQVHLNFKIFNILNTPDIHGVLGQTYKGGIGRVTRSMEYQLLSKLTGGPVVVDDASGAGFLDGDTASYRTTSITSADCKFTQFVI